MNKYRLSVRLTAEEHGHLAFLKASTGQSFATIIRRQLVAGGACAPKGVGKMVEDGKIRRGIRPMPPTTSALLATIGEVLADHQVVEIVVRLGSPILFSFVGGEAGEDLGDGLRPYDVLRMGEVVEYDGGGEADALRVIAGMFTQLVDAGHQPVCWIVGSTAVYEWAGMPCLGRHRQGSLYGLPVFVDSRFGRTTVILAGSASALAGVGGLRHGLRHTFSARAHSSVAQP